MKEKIMDRIINKVMNENEDEGIDYLYKRIKGLDNTELEKLAEVINEVLEY
jgi:hypothetical protein